VSDVSISQSKALAVASALQNASANRVWKCGHVLECGAAAPLSSDKT